MRTGLLGKTLAHSISPRLHGLLGDENYRLFEIPEEDVGAFMTGGAWDAINVTIPYKKTVIPYCSSLSDRAAAIGSVNTVVRRPDGTLYGDNTDFAGFSDMARDVDFKGRKTVILGSGGASLTVQAAVKHLGASSVTVISRSGDDNYSNLSRHADADIIVNTTPVGMYPHEAESPISLDTFTSPSALLDLIYNPLRTRLVLEAADRGIYSRGGLRMLCTQAYEARRVFGCENKIGTDTLYKTVLGERENIVIIGMPGCGKTVFGRKLSRKTGKKFFDTDILIYERCGIRAGEIIEKYGEARFREIESDVLRELCRKSGVIIATGGGAVLREENRLAMRSCGKVLFIDRPPEKLTTDGRPLSSTPEKLAALYEKRLPIYRATADIAVKVPLWTREAEENLFAACAKPLA